MGAKQTGDGYEVAFSIAGQNEYVVWNTDSNGDYTSTATGILSGSNPTLEAVEANFGEHFAGAGAPPSTTMISTNGTTTLAQVGNLFELNPAGGGTGPLLELNGGVVTAGQFPAGWTPVGAVQTDGGYEVAWSVPGKNEYAVWNTDSNGNFTGGETGAAPGEPPAVWTINTNGVTSLVQVGNHDELEAVSTGTGPLIELNGSAVAAGQFPAGWTPVGAEQTGGGYEVAWSIPGANEFVVWNTDSNGDYTSPATDVLSGASPELEAIEAAFGEQFPGAGPPASKATIATNGVTTLAQVGDLFELNPAGGGTGPLIELNGSAVTAGQFAAGWTPVGAVKTASGYEVAWSVLGANEYVVWNTDSNGDYTSAATGVVSGQSFALEDLNPLFGENLNGAPSLSGILVTTDPGGVVNLSAQTQNTTIKLGANSARAIGGLNASSLSFNGAPYAITLGSDCSGAILAAILRRKSFVFR
jgi:serralysin